MTLETRHYIFFNIWLACEPLHGTLMNYEINDLWCERDQHEQDLFVNNKVKIY